MLLIPLSMDFDTRFAEALLLNYKLVTHGLFDTDLPDRDTGK